MAQLAPDSFTRADAGTLGANWTGVSSGIIGVTSNRAIWKSGSGFCAAAYSGSEVAALTPDQYAEIKCVVLASGMDFGPGVRMSGTSDSDVRGYVFACNITSAALALGATTFDVGIVSFTGGTGTAFQLGATVSNQTISASTVLRLEAQGTFAVDGNITIRGYLDGALVITRTSITIDDIGGAGFYIGNSGGTTAMDDFAVGDLTGASNSIFRLAPSTRTYRPAPYRPGIAR